MSFHSQKGATIVEYALLVALVAVISIGALKLLGINVAQKFRCVFSSANCESSDGTGSSGTGGPY